MLSIVQSCQELQNERINNSIKEHHNPQVPKEPKSSNIFTIFKGIVPGKYKQAQNLFNISLIIGYFGQVFENLVYTARNSM